MNIMKQLLLLDKHSFVDVITNSSSEIFVCDTDKSEKFIKEFLEKCLETYNFGNGSNYAFDNCFGPIEVITEENFEKFVDEYVIDWGLHRWNWNVEKIPDYWDFTRSLEAEGLVIDYKVREDKDAELKRREDNERFNKEIEDRWEALKKNWKEKNIGVLKESLMGNICIHSNGDNSIPYELFDMIERSLNATRQHLG
jgi:hypothetical protein